MKRKLDAKIKAKAEQKKNRKSASLRSSAKKDEQLKAAKVEADTKYKKD